MEAKPVEPRPLRALRLALLPALLGVALAAACGGAVAGSEPMPPAPTTAPLADPELVDVRSAIEAGRGDIARRLLDGLTGLEPTLLRARAHWIQGDNVAALREIEAARQLAPDHPEVWGTEAEFLAAQDRIDAAADSLEQGFRRAGHQPVLERARGVIELCISGHCTAALEALERAQARDAEMPFLRFPLAQAHLLVGRMIQGERPGEALAHARAAQRLDPTSLDARELEAEALAATMEFEQSIAIYAELEHSGRDVGHLIGPLEQRCATRCLLQHQRAEAVTHYLAARARGLGDEDLGFGRDVLAEEAAAALDRGIARAEAEDWPAAEVEFARALELAPASLEAENHLSVARFRAGEYRAAAEGWERVLARAEAQGLALPDPVPLNLARAWRLAGERERARAALSHTLDRDPSGPWSEEARELLVGLEAEELAASRAAAEAH